jgi:hypothetical protein
MVGLALLFIVFWSLVFMTQSDVGILRIANQRQVAIVIDRWVGKGRISAIASFPGVSLTRGIEVADPDAFGESRQMRPLARFAQSRITKPNPDGFRFMTILNF